jgi:hypothetical protein
VNTKAACVYALLVVATMVMPLKDAMWRMRAAALAGVVALVLLVANLVTVRLWAALAWLIAVLLAARLGEVALNQWMKQLNEPKKR